MTDAVYPLGTGSLVNNEEIRFSLRSLVANAQGLGKVFIVGEKPDFLTFGGRLIHIPYQERHFAYRNVWEKLRLVSEDDRISEKFIFMNDDFYVVKPFEAGNIPHYSRGGTLGGMPCKAGRLGDIAIADIRGSYYRCLKCTHMALQERGLSTYLFSTHQPVNFERTKVREILNEFRRELRQPYGLSFRCCYGNFYGIDRIVRPTKILKDTWNVPGGRLAFATHRDVDRTLLINKLTAMYPDRSIFERNS